MEENKKSWFKINDDGLSLKLLEENNKIYKEKTDKRDGIDKYVSLTLQKKLALKKLYTMLNSKLNQKTAIELYKKFRELIHIDEGLFLCDIGAYYISKKENKNYCGVILSLDEPKEYKIYMQDLYDKTIINTILDNKRFYAVVSKDLNLNRNIILKKEELTNMIKEKKIYIISEVKSSYIFKYSNREIEYDSFEKFPIIDSNFKYYDCTFLWNILYGNNEEVVNHEDFKLIIDFIINTKVKNDLINLIEEYFTLEELYFKRSYYEYLQNKRDTERESKFIKKISK